MFSIIEMTIMDIYDKYDARLNSIKNVYLLVAVLGVVTIIVTIFEQSQKEAITSIPSSSLIVIVYLLICYGLKRRREWVIPLVLAVSASSLITLFLQHAHLLDIDYDPKLEPLRNVFFIMRWLIYLAAIFFFAYQIYFFSKREIRKRFGVSEQIIF